MNAATDAFSHSVITGTGIGEIFMAVSLFGVTDHSITTMSTEREAREKIRLFLIRISARPEGRKLCFQNGMNSIIELAINNRFVCSFFHDPLICRIKQ